METDPVRAAIGAVIGVVVAGIVVAITETIGHALFPPPPGIDVSNPADLERLWDVVQPGAKAMVALAWFLGPLAGACTAIAIGRRVTSALIVGAILAAMALWTSQMFPHPAWMVVAAVVLPLLAVLAAKRLMAGRLAA